MSSRVQKGGTLFKPIAKSRSRTVPVQSRQPSTALEPIRDSAEPTPDPAPTPDQPQCSPPTPPPLEPSSKTSGTHIVPPTDTLIPGNDTSATIIASGHSAPRASAPPQLISSNPRLPVSIPSQPGLRPPSGPASIPMPTPPGIRSATPINPPSINSQNPAQLPPREPSVTSILTPIIPPSSSSLHATRSPATTLSEEDNSTQPSEQGSSAEPEVLKPKPRKRKKNDSTPETDTGGQSSDTSTKRARKGTRKRAPSPPPYDINADPGEDIDPTTVTMASLCVDTGQGRVSSKAAEILNNHAAWKLKNREKRARMRAAMEAKKYGRPTEEDLEEMETNESTSALSQPNQAPAEAHDVVDESGNDFDYTQGLARNQYNVQVRIGPNGETIIDEESLVVDRAEPESTTEGYTHVVESDHTKFVNSGTYGKRYRGSRWSAEETEMFYDALAQYGENYELIAYVLPGRDRKSCKNKFKIEDKRNPARINHCLNNRIPVDIKTLARITGKDFSGPTPVIKAPPPPRPPTPPADPGPPSDDEPPRTATKRSRSKSASGTGLIIVGNVPGMQE